MLGSDEDDPLEIQKRETFDRFELICDKRGLTPQQLADAPHIDLAAWMLEELPAKQRRHGVDPAKLRPLVADYLAACDVSLL